MQIPIINHEGTTTNFHSPITTPHVIHGTYDSGHLRALSDRLL